MSTLCLGRICRICLLELSAMHKLLDIKRNHLKIEEMLSTIVPSLNLSVDTEAAPIPVEICDDCVEKLQLSYDFHQLCMSSNERLKHFLKNRAKENALPSSVNIGYEDLPNEIGHDRSESVQDLQETIKMEIGEELVTVVQLSDSILKEHDILEEEFLSDAENVKDCDDQCEGNAIYDLHSHADDIKDHKSKSHLPAPVTDLGSKRKYKISNQMSSNERLKSLLKCREKGNSLPSSIDAGYTDQSNDIGQQNENSENIQDLQQTVKMEIGEELVTVVQLSGSVVTKHEPLDEEFLSDAENVEDYDDHYVENDLHSHEDNITDHESKSHLPTGVANMKPARKYKERISSITSKTCPHCHKIFTKNKNLTRHLTVHSLEHQFVCDICHYRYATEELLKTHILFTHKSGVATRGLYKCPDCPMIFQQTSAVVAHRVKHLKRDFNCQICGVNLKTLAAVTDHLKCKHPSVLPYKCEMCEQAFSEETHFNDHINMHKGYKKHKCKMCHKSECPLNVKVSLQEHMHTHSKQKPYVCNICGSSYTRASFLKAHKFEHSSDKSFVYKLNLMKQKITHTGEKSHMCTYCNLPFASTRGLHSHLRSYCNRSYAASGDLVKHLRTHLGENMYFCDECPEKFKYQQELRDHKCQH